MNLKIGIPRALLYYYYYPLWKTFFQELGAEVVLSSPSSKVILDNGLKHAVDEICLPIKMAFGHVQDLAGKVDYIFLPRLVSVKKHEYICPKFLGFPDLVRCLDGLPPLIDINVNYYKNKKDAYFAVKEAGKLFTNNYLKIWGAYRSALDIQKKYFRLLQLGLMPDEALAGLEEGVEEKPRLHQGEHTVALLGHPYNIYDSYINMNLIRRLRTMGVNVLTAECLSERVVRNCASGLSKKLFWTLGQRMIGAAFHSFKRHDISGIVYVAAFACGPDSMTGDLIAREARVARMPFMNLTLDEHTGETGIVTRIEAFMDMVRWRKAGLSK
jgi:predicted nucleotide-binding protein (sugar kinase/HSP70/actin superfamily)